MESKPKKIFILIGINDLSANFPMDQIVDNYKQIINKIKIASPKTEIFIQSTLDDSEIEGITNSKFTAKSFQETFKDFSLIYPRLPLETKRRLNKLIFSEITSTLNKKDTNGEIIIKMRGDCELKTGLDNIKKCLKRQDCNPFGGNDTSNNSTIETKNSSSISEVRAFDGACSTGSSLSETTF